MEDRPTHSIDEIVDAGELKTMEGNEDEYLLCRQEVERGDPYGGDGKGVSRYTCSSGDGSLNKVGSDESSKVSLSPAEAGTGGDYSSCMYDERSCPSSLQCHVTLIDGGAWRIEAGALYMLFQRHGFLRGS